MAVVDYDNQEILSNNISQIKISAVTFNATLKGIDYAKVTQGVGLFDNLQFIYPSGGQNIEYVANSKAIDKTLINIVFGSQLSNNTIFVDFRWCQPGEIQQADKTCRK